MNERIAQMQADLEAMEGKAILLEKESTTIKAEQNALKKQIKEAKATNVLLQAFQKAVPVTMSFVYKNNKVTIPAYMCHMIITSEQPHEITVTIVNSDYPTMEKAITKRKKK